MVVGGYCHVASRGLVPLRNEPPEFLVLPMSAISGLVSLLIYPHLRDQRDRSSRVRTLYLGFVLSMAIYGSYLWVMVSDGGPGLVVLALLAGHLYGGPLFLALVLAFVSLERSVFPPPRSMGVS